MRLVYVKRRVRWIPWPLKRGEITGIPDVETAKRLALSLGPAAIALEQEKP